MNRSIQLPKLTFSFSLGLIMILVGLLLPNFRLDFPETPLSLLLSTAVGHISLSSLFVSLLSYPSLVLCLLLGLMSLAARIAEVTWPESPSPHRLIASLTLTIMFLLTWFVTHTALDTHHDGELPFQLRTSTLLTSLLVVAYVLTVLCIFRSSSGKYYLIASVAIAIACLLSLMFVWYFGSDKQVAIGFYINAVGVIVLSFGVIHQFIRTKA